VYRHVRNGFAPPSHFSSGRQVRSVSSAVGKLADGVVVGSALVEALSVATSPEDAAARASAFLAPLRQALDSLSA